MLADKDIVHIHMVLTECHKLSGLDEFKTFIRTKIRQILPHQMALCGLFEIRSRRILRLINIDFPTAYLQQVIRPDQVLLSSPLRAWLGKRSPMIARVDHPGGREESLWYPGARVHGITSLACHGIVDVSSTVSSYFAFGQLKIENISSYTTLLNLIVPHLHAVLMRLLTVEHLIRTGAVDAGPALRGDQPENEVMCGDVTARERQVLRWIAVGKSNWEIGKILRISEFTVKNHVQNVLKKLSVTSRAQAVTTAIFCGLIGGDVVASEAADAQEPPARSRASEARPQDGRPAGVREPSGSRTRRAS